MTIYFPALLNIDYKKVVIVGGGLVARQKLNALLPTKAEIIVVSPEVHESILPLFEEPQVKWRQKNFEASDLDDAALIFAVTNSEEVNNAVEEATQHWQLLSRADALGRVDFINPAVVRRGDLVLSVSTSGASPGLTRKIKADLEQQFDESYASYIDFLQQAREQIKRTFTNRTQRTAALQAMLDPRIFDWIRAEEQTKCEQFLQQLLDKEDL
ncbi:precorrin-2 dehydrogenase/sirohydrochlorin ferrochelatase family protein [Solibacillus sp. FSL H8-0538]|uniref:precorrin-2 dehydrogenase/sirohydrochlorin ferrochelatase family protein n=1 Tax=Solibacillus sp. FSL H8-0538 TaxID=2921400 RepID=UPI0030F5F92C